MEDLCEPNLDESTRVEENDISPQLTQTSAMHDDSFNNQIMISDQNDQKNLNVFD